VMEITVRHTIELSPTAEAFLRELLSRVVPPPPPKTPFVIGAKAAPAPKAEAPTTARRQCFTPEREALLRELYPSGATMGEILARLNAMPGEQVTSGLVYVYTSHAGLKRPSRPVSARVPSATPRPPVWSDDRMLALQNGWESGDDAEDILKTLNAMPGERIASPNVVRAKAMDEAFVRPRSKPAPIVDGKVLADWGQIDAWASQRGLRMQSAGDLAPINVKRGQLGLPLFALPEART
jgi:hypothetical protein